jgi:phage tail-like protein
MTDTAGTTMAPAAAPGNVIDPFRAYTFNLLIKNVPAGHFTEVRGLGLRIDRISYREAGLKSIERQVPGQVSFSPVELCNGLTSDVTLWNWLTEVRDGKVRREEVSIAVLDPSGASEMLRWNLSRAWPCEWRGAPLSASSRELAIETLILAHEGIERVDRDTAGTGTPPAGA